MRVLCLTLGLILAAGTMAASLGACAEAATQHKTYHTAKPKAGHKAAPHKAAPKHSSSKKSWSSHGKTTHKKTYRHSYKPKPKPKPGIQADGRYVLPGGMETTCAGGTPPPCR